MTRQSHPDSQIEADYVRSKAAMGLKERDSVDRRFVTEQSMKPISWWVEIPTF